MMNIEKALFLSITVSVSVACLPVEAEMVHMRTPSTSMVVEATEGQPLMFRYYGSSLGTEDLNNLAIGGMSPYQAYPTYGLRSISGNQAVAMVQPDGNMTLDLAVQEVENKQEKDGANVTRVIMKDRVYPVTVTVAYRTWPEEDVIETWTEICNNEEAAVRLDEFDSGYLPIRRGHVWMTSLGGTWGNEAQVESSPLPFGWRVISNRDGVRNATLSHPEVMLSLDGEPNEEAGRVIGAALEYSGNYRIRVNTDDSDYHHLFAGIDPSHSAYTLDSGECFTTPPLALTYSDHGLGGVSRAFHGWGRRHRIHHGTEPNKVLLNSWEGVYLNIKEPQMNAMMEDVAQIGGELFVMDDGWFGDRYRRDRDNAALGDWSVDERKLPHGIKGLTDKALKEGIGFGIWIEPEMVNTASRLYEEHPEYLIKARGRDLQKGRGGAQAVLDLSNPAVQELVFNVVDTLLTNYPKIEYIKWDANAEMMEHGSQYLTEDKQSHLFIDYHHGLQSVMERIRKKYPDVAIQACASGGGRASYGLLPWFDEFWTSDNTDALQRLKIQWGTGYFYPAVAMASHISASPNHQTRRRIPMKFRADVAMSGRLGVEMLPSAMNARERKIVSRAIADYKTVRSVVQQGDLYRLNSPYDNDGITSLMYVTPQKDDAVFYWWKTDASVNPRFPTVPMAGLDQDGVYKISELNRLPDEEPMEMEGKTFTGRYLMGHGLEMPTDHYAPWEYRDDLASRVIRLQKVK